MSDHRVLVANRGEIAVRIIRAAHDVGWEAVAVYSDADAESQWVKRADDAVHIGPSPASKSYLDPVKIVEAAKSADCDAVHPGYGFLSERASFAQAVAEAGLVFVGPSADVISRMGDKAAARHAAIAADVPVVPGSDVVSDTSDALRIADDIGYPVLVKASAGGGGRGIRIVESPEGLEGAISTAQAEARSAFGDDSVYLEKVIVGSRHVEVQVVADRHGNVAHAYERDCSVQRRRQKLLEEAPAPGLPSETRAAMLEASVRLAAEVDYVGAGTIEYLVSDDGNFYFIEMNTRIQVEHPISEEVTGVDLVAEQLRVAVGDPLSFAAQDIECVGTSFEFRINAEDPDNDFFPSPGALTRFDLPRGEGIRVETGYVTGDNVSPYYDSLLAKLVVTGADRADAIKRSIEALTDLRIEGVKTTRDVHLRLLTDSAVADGPVTTSWLEDFLARHA